METNEIIALNPNPCPPVRPRPKSEGLDVLAIAVAVAALAVRAADEESRQPADPRAKRICG
jgi:hypothetical protein